MPLSGVIIAFASRGEVLYGCIYDPFRDELFTARCLYVCVHEQICIAYECFCGPIRPLYDTMLTIYVYVCMYMYPYVVRASKCFSPTPTNVSIQLFCMNVCMYVCMHL